MRLPVPWVPQNVHFVPLRFDLKPRMESNILFSRVPATKTSGRGGYIVRWQCCYVACTCWCFSSFRSWQEYQAKLAKCGTAFRTGVLAFLDLVVRPVPIFLSKKVDAFSDGCTHQLSPSGNPGICSCR